MYESPSGVIRLPTTPCHARSKNVDCERGRKRVAIGCGAIDSAEALELVVPLPIPVPLPAVLLVPLPLVLAPPTPA
ncbi:hypothetical protein KC335_g46 [Hortaea werneckii]|nr:hypothetical protein KC335_g46 [Hortaea werneckii]